jgi:transcriptional regulator with XRE-family HTH domain
MRKNDITPEQIRAARKAAGLTQAQAAKLIGLGSQTRWSEYEHGVRTMRVQSWRLFRLLTGQESLPK